MKPNSAFAFADAESGQPRLLVRRDGGDYAIYSAECTHQGCTVSYKTGDGGYLVCPCHNSVFALKDGTVVSGPAEEPLAKLRVKVEKGEGLLGLAQAPGQVGRLRTSLVRSPEIFVAGVPVTSPVTDP